MAPAKKPSHWLKVSAGPSALPKDLQTISVNDDANPVWIENDEFVGQIVVRIKGFTNSTPDHDKLTPVMSESLWFQKPGGANHICSIQIHGRFKREWTGDQVLFGDQFERPLRLPPFTSTAMKFLHILNPGLEADLSSARPSAFCPLIGTMNTVRVSDIHTSSLFFPPWPSKTGDHVEEDTTLLFTPRDNDSTYSSIDGEDQSKKGVLKMTSAERRSYFTKMNHLKSHVFRTTDFYDFDFFNQFLDLSGFKLKLPGLSIDIRKPLDGQPLTFVVKTKDNSVVFFAVQFELVPVEDS
ncbi:hypothetical protein BG004_000400 [Podila humilis]|nr:hypothetical protein BG004_000400 [Podila humilis]